MKKTGRPKIIIDGGEVQKLAGYGLSNCEIADFFGVDEGTIRKGFSEILSKGRANLRMRLRMKQLEIAMRGNVTMLIFLGKNMLNQSDRQEIDHSGKIEYPAGVLLIPKVADKEKWLKEVGGLEKFQKNLRGDSENAPLKRG